MKKPVMNSKLTKNKKRLLIVGNNHPQLMVLRFKLIEIGFEVMTSTDWQQALENAREFTPDAIISDFDLPLLDGFVLCLAIRQNAKLQSIPVLLITSHYLEPEDYALANRVGANALISCYDDICELLIKLHESFLQQNLPLNYDKPLNALPDTHIDRMGDQLDKQLMTSLMLSQRCSLQNAQLTFLSKISNTHNKHESMFGVLKTLLANCLNVADVSKGILYIIENNKISLKLSIGFDETNNDLLDTFFNQSDLLMQVVSKKVHIQISSLDLTKDVAERILEQAEITYGLLVPIFSSTECVGILFLGDVVTNVCRQELFFFAQSIGKYIGQTIEVQATIEKLKKSETRYKTLMERANIAIFVQNPQGHILESNRMAEELLGCSKEHMIGMNFREFIINEEHAHVSKLENRMLTGFSIENAESHVRRPNGEIRTIEAFGTKIDLGGKRLIYVMVTDVTERNQLRSQALLNEKLATMGLLTSGIAHEINNPLAWIISNLELISEELIELEQIVDSLSNLTRDNEITDKIQKIDTLLALLSDRKIMKTHKKLLHDASDGARRVLQLTQDLKGFSRTDESEEHIDIHQVLNSAINMAQSEFKHRAHIQLEFLDEMPLVTINAAKLQQVFLNLIVNAAQAIPEGNADDNEIKISTKVDGDYILIQICDTGRGISNEVSAKIFDPFFTTKPVGVGTGLGLFICHEIITKMGGKIEVESKVEQGTVFSIYLPYRLSEQEKIILSEAI